MGSGRIAAVEVMMATSTIRDLILDPERTDEIMDLIAEGRDRYRSQTFDQHLLDLELGIRRDGLRWPTGLISGQKLYFMLQALTVPVEGVSDFDQLAIPEAGHNMNLVTMSGCLQRPVPANTGF